MCLYVKYDMLDVASISISFHNLEYFIVVFVPLVSTNYHDAILGFWQSYIHMMDRYERVLLANSLQILFHDGGSVPLKFFLYWCKSHGSTSKWGVSCSKDLWSFFGINTTFFPWLETRLSKGSNSFLVWCELSDFVNCIYKRKYTTIWTLLSNSKYLPKCHWKYKIKTLVYSLFVCKLIGCKYSCGTRMLLKVSITKVMIKEIYERLLWEIHCRQGLHLIPACLVVFQANSSPSEF